MPRPAAMSRRRRQPPPPVAPVKKARRWPPETRQTALERLTTQTIATVHRDMNIPKGTLSGWASAAGIRPGGAERTDGKTSRATEEAARVRRETVARAREQLLVAQSQIALAASALELEVLEAARAVVEHAKTNRSGVIPVELTARLDAALMGPRLPDIVGSKTRAIHDLQLLDGQPTEGQPDAAGMVVVFATPPPAPSGRKAPRVIDLEPDPPREIGSG